MSLSATLHPVGYFAGMISQSVSPLFAYAERNITMPLSFGIPLGLTMVLVGVILFFTTSRKKLAKVIPGIGIAITRVTLVLIVLAVNSSM